MNPSPFLSKEELQELTGRALHRLQRAWLKTQGWTFTVNANGRPIVSRAHMENMLGGASRMDAATDRTCRPNFDAIR